MTPVPTEPVHLVEDSATGDRLLIYGTDKGIKIELRYDGDTLWITQAQIAELFGRDVSTISRHINNIIEEGELTEESSLQKAQISTGRPAALYSLDMVISVGYRVSYAVCIEPGGWSPISDIAGIRARNGSSDALAEPLGKQGVAGKSGERGCQ